MNTETVLAVCAIATRIARTVAENLKVRIQARMVQGLSTGT